MKRPAQEWVPLMEGGSRVPGFFGVGVRLALFSLLLFQTGTLRAGVALHQPIFTIQNVLLGRVYVASRDILKSPLRVTNGTDTPMKCTVQFYVPNPDQLREGAEPIPDASWFTPARDSFDLPAGKDGTADFYLTIPNDQSLLGRKFQVQFVALTSAVGQAVQLGLGGRAFLIMMDKPVEWAEGEKNLRQYGVQFRPEPHVIQGNDFILGRRVSLKELAGGPWLVKNDGDYPAKVSVRVVTYEETHKVLPQWFEAGPDPKKIVTISTKRLSIPPHEAKEVKGSVLLPNRIENRGKNFGYFIAVESEDKRAPVIKYGTIFLRTIL
jgi:hypothetical protein